MPRWGLLLAVWCTAVTAGCADYTLHGKWDDEAFSPTPTDTASLTPTPEGSVTPTPDPGTGVVYYSNFEDNDGGLVVLDGGGEGPPTWEWGAGGPGAPSGVRIWDTNLQGDYGDSERSCISLAVTVPAAARWRSKVRWETEEGFDAIRMRVCPPAAPVTGNDCDTLLDDESGTSNGFETLLYDLAPYAGTARELRWCIFADSAIEEPGISVDDVAVGTSAGLATLPP